MFEETVLQSDKSRKTKCPQQCPLCGEGEENVTHMLFICDGLSNARIKLWSEMENILPKAMIEEIDNLHSPEKSVFIFSGFLSAYVKEWDVLYGSVLDFVTAMYRVRVNMEETN